MSRPFVSVIIPTYNRLSFLKEAIASVLDQTVFDRIPVRQKLLYKTLVYGSSGSAGPERMQGFDAVSYTGGPSIHGGQPVLKPTKVQKSDTTVKVCMRDSPLVELIIVDDGSLDGTESFCSALVLGKGRLIARERLRSNRSRVGLHCGELSAVGPENPLEPAGVSQPGKRPSVPLGDSSVLSIRYLRLLHTGRPGLVRNRGASLAHGPYLAFLDSDDLWEPEKLEQQLAWMLDHPPYRISHTKEMWIRRLPDGGEKTVSQAKQRHRKSGYIFLDALKKCIIGPSTVMLEKSLFEETGGFREDLEIAEDYELWLRITAQQPVGYIDRPLSVKRGGHDDQLSWKYPYIELFRIQALSRLVEGGWFSRNASKERLVEESWLKCNMPQQLAKAELVRKCRIYANGCRKRGKLEEALYWEQVAEKTAGELATDEGTAD